MEKIKSKDNPIKPEKFSGKKFILGLLPFNLIWWGKAVSDFLKVVVIFGLIFGIVFGVGWWIGRKEQPMPVRYKDFKAYVKLADGNKHTVEVKNNFLFVDNKLIRVKDIPKLKSFGIDIRLKAFVGYGKEGIEPGIGVSFVRLFRVYHFDIFGTTKAGYVGLSREINFKDVIRNSSIGVGFGTKFDTLLNKKEQKDIRFIIYCNVPF